ncbi:hypothetical protein [Halorubrum sp. CSM-61]|uniref:hypothetical protein n=1 Tax=Halorubrum sp. CSM-61 TaxID=2485838 RepID=UPI000F4BBBB2|nr:hypothetical protein [Halorubrum sp. CSM-61]
MVVEYRVADAYEEIRSEPDDSVAFIHLDDAWARPKRGNAFGVEYPTHPFSREDDHFEPDKHEFVVTDIVAECIRVLRPDGILVADTDSWLFPQLFEWLCDRLDSGCARSGGVTLLSADGTPDCSTPGQYGSSGGYSVVMASPASCPGLSSYSVADRQHEQYGWGTVKPLSPYKTWVREATASDDRILVPCAGTAPTAIAAEMLYEDPDVLAIDVESDARDAYERRRTDELNRQASLSGWA